MEWRSENRVRVGGLEFRQDRYDRTIFGPDWKRILFLGDSFTEGSGIENDENRFVDIVVEEINTERGRDGALDAVHAFNAGVAGSFPVQWVDYYRTLREIYEPDMVIAVFFLRDGTRLSTSLRLNREIIDPIREKYATLPLHDHSAVLRFAYGRLMWREYTADFKRRLIAGYLGSEEEQATWREQQAALAWIADDCRARGIPFHLVVFPLLFDLDDYDFFPVERAILEFAERHDIPAFSLTPGFLGLEDRTLWVASNDQHPNELAHRTAADTLLPYVREALVEPGH